MRTITTKTFNCLKIYEAGYIDALYVRVDNLILLYIYEILYITYIGHEFLSNIWNVKNWTKTKDIGKKVGAFGLNMAGKIAEGVATAYSKHILGIS